MGTKQIGIIGAGWLGLPLGKELVAEGHTVWGTTTRRERFPELGAAGIQSFRYLGGITRDLPDAEVLVIAVPPRNKKREYFRMLDSLVRYTKERGCKKVLFVSSTSVYPDDNQEVIEKDAVRRISRHSNVRMIMLENRLLAAEDLQLTILRFGGLYGPGRHPGRFLAGKKGVAGADNPVNLIRLEDCLGIMMKVIESNAWGHVWNAVAPGHPTRREFYERAARAGGFEPPEWDTELKRPWKKVNGAKLERELGYTYLFPDPGAEWENS